MKIVGKEIWSSEDDEEARRMFEAGVPVKEIAAAVGRKPHAIYYRNHWAWKINRGKVSPARWSTKDICTAKRMLRRGSTYEEVAQVVGRTEAAVKIKNNTSWRLPVARKNAVWTDDDYFDEWSENMAYVLGFVAADGNVDQDLKATTIAQSHDYGREHLEKIQKLIGGNIYGPDKNDGYRLICYSRPMAERLNALGLTPAKSNTLLLPAVPEALFVHFLRGVFDGDGCVSRNHKRGERPDLRASIASGSKLFLEALRVRVQEVTGIVGKITRWELTWRGSRGRVLLHWLYENKDASIWMDRKFTKYQTLLSEREVWGDRRLLIRRRPDGSFLPGKVQV